jgi:small-conductance mechanosensitive channel/CRP-like cAMP-binding protein
VKRVASLFKAIAVPVLVVGLFFVGALYEQEILVRLGMATVAQLRSIVPYTLHIGIWFSLAYLLNRVIGVTVWDPLNRRMPVPRLLRDVTGALIYALAVTGVVSVVFDKPIGPSWAASGAGAIVIGLALRNVIMDVFIGLAINFDRPFEIGDFIQVSTGNNASVGPSGRVVELNWRTTRLLTGEGNLVVVPNGKLGDMIVTNFSKPESMGEFELSVFLDFDVPTDRALRVLNAAVRSVSGTTGIPDEPPPKARIRGVTTQGVEYKIKYLLDPRKAGPGKARHEVWRAVLDQLHRAGLQPALPKQDVFNAERPIRQLDTGATQDRVAILSRVELFSGLTAEEREALAVAMRLRLFKEGAKVIERGQPGESMFILSEGLLDVMIVLKPGQPESRVARLQAGSFFGEMSALTGEPRTATILAATDALMFEIAKPDLAALVQRRPEVAEVISQAVAARKLRNSKAAAEAGTPSRVSEEESLASQLVTKMLSFFGVKRRAVLTPQELDRNASLSPFS